MALTQISTDGIKNGTITGADLATNIDLVDNQKIRFGTGNDLEIYHTGSGSVINDVGTGHLHLRVSGSNRINVEPNGVSLCYDGNKKFETTSTGITSISTDAGAAQFGTSGTATSFAVTAQPELMVGGGATKDNAIGIESNTTAGLDYDSNLVLARSRGTYANKGIVQTGDFLGRVGFYGYDGAEYERAAEIAAVIDGTPGTNDMPTRLDFKTTQDSTNVPATRFRITNGGNIQIPADDKKLQIGASQDLEIFKDGNHVRIKDNQSANGFATVINTDHLRINNLANTENLARFLKDGAVELFHNNSKKLETTSAGVTVTGTLTNDGIRTGDLEYICAGNSCDIAIYHDSNGSINGTSGSSYIKCQGVHDNILNIFTSSATGKINLKSNNNAETMLSASGNGAVELYYDNSKKLETTSTGVTVTSNVRIPDGGKYFLGSDDDMYLNHSGSHGAIHNATGNIYFSTAGSIFFSTQLNESAITANANGAVELYFNNSKKLETYNGGVEVFGDFSLGDNRVLNVGTGSDLQIFHDGSNSIINEAGTGSLRIQTGGSNQWEFNGAIFKGNDGRAVVLGDSSDFEIFHNGTDNIINCKNDKNLKIVNDVDGGNETMAFFDPNGEVELYHDGSKKFETTSSGATVTGRLKQTTGCAFRARATSDGQSIPANTATKVIFGTQVYDYGDVYNPSNSRFTAPVDGVYNFSWSIRMGTPTSTPKLDAEIRVNGSPGVNFVNCGYNQQASNNAAWIGSGDMFMSAGDYAELFVDQNTSSTTNLSDTSNANTLNPGNHIWWTGHLIHAA